MKNWSIILKMLVILGAFGLFSLGTGFYASIQIMKIDAGYSSLLVEQVRAAQNMASAGRALQRARAAIADSIMLADPKAVEQANSELAAAKQTFSELMDVAAQASPENKHIPEFKQAGLDILEKQCARALDQGSKTTNAMETMSAVKTFATECQPGFPQLAEKIVAETRTLEQAALKARDDLTIVSTSTSNNTLLILFGGLALVLAASYFAVSSWIVKPINALRDLMAVLAGGNLDVDVAGTDRRDEIGKMAAAVQVFKDNGLKARELEGQSEEMRAAAERNRQAEQERIAREAEQLRVATSTLGDALKRLAHGDLACRINAAFAAEYEPLRADFNATVDQLSRTINAVAVSVQSMDNGTREISSGANDLSKRTEQQAASLEETAAALDQITANVGNSTKRTEEARTVASRANHSAVHSAEVVSQAEGAMKKIEESSQQISNIIGVIDEIAFQTNLLALNAGVEAARAGEAGKGFAVVAQEVRELAQRSAQAAKEIKGLIQNSSADVGSGVKLVRDTGEALKMIGGFIVEINTHMEAIAISAKEQSTGLAEINTAVNQMDQTTQQNAAMVEQSSAAAVSLAQEASKLRDLVGQFRLDAAAQLSAPGQTAHAATPDSKPVASPARALGRKIAGAFGGKATAVATAEDWEEF
ncbi:methyl-accepting chemotaxis protein [Sinorhizobium americanum]|uniref:Chemoreceptor McpA n=1 Tax=Sinorhizobium americanum TaxID=194963 RepID=A0A1L3LXV2_9HYPH|nr:methyl-accepting chemotaxis protein [Sinorhizobium americanum]APG94945.1 chemoreceptor McpA [Sinorhizobium americanum]OAP37162.1 chemotaxis protein [Sinorhizobium americanum]